MSPTLSHKSSSSENSLRVSQNPGPGSQVIYTVLSFELPYHLNVCCVVQVGLQWVPNPDWVLSWKQKLPLQTIMRLLQVLVPQVEKICIDK